jgi:hypothetical protein
MPIFSSFQRQFLLASSLHACVMLWVAGWTTAAAEPIDWGRVSPRDLVLNPQHYDPQIPTPRDVLKFDIGERHLLHHELIGYLTKLAEVSPRVTMHEYARSHGHRPLVLLTITSPENHARLDAIREAHQKLSDPTHAAEVELEDLPAVINMGYGVHGNEPSASNVAPLVAYHLAAGRGEVHERLLRDLVILIDPCLNPDGFDRFANWANDHRGAIPNPDPRHREHQEPWPSGRTNYYWFDLNRDWMPVQHPESQGRLNAYHTWKPNVVLDFHEMGTDSTYFFQPGAPNRNHPLIPPQTLDLTRRFADYHASALDRVGSLYFTEERFDDFYVGKGSTYPDLHGAVGILFEQASSRGHVQMNRYGKISFPFTIRNQWLTSQSSLRATQRLRLPLLEHQRDFYLESRRLAQADSIRGYVVAAPGDPARLHYFLEVLDAHAIRAHRLAVDVEADGFTYRAGQSFVIPTDQPEYRFLTDLFTRRTKFDDVVFYDVSAWTLPLAFELRTASLSSLTPELLGEVFSFADFPRRKPIQDEKALAYIIDWRGYLAPRVLYQLHAAGVQVLAATEPFVTQDENGNKRRHGRGSLLVHLGIQPEKRRTVIRLLQKAAEDSVVVTPVHSGLTPEGIDLGSSRLVPLTKPRVLLVTGGNTTEAGEVWHLLDRRLQMPVTLVDAARLGDVNFSDYTAVVVVSGRYSEVATHAVSNLKTFINQGGTLIAIGTAVRWLQSQQLASVSFREPNAEPPANRPLTARRPFSEAREAAAKQEIAGAILATQVDTTHPIAYGYNPSAQLPVFRDHSIVLEPSKNPYGTPLIYDAEPLLSGYLSAENRDILSQSASVLIHSSGSGRVIILLDNPNFRGFWYGTNRLFFNSLFFGSLMREA